MKSFAKKTSLILLAAGLFASTASADHIALKASQDTSIRSDHTGGNGTGTFIFVGQTPTAQFHSLLTFDLTSLAGQLPVGARINSVSLQLAIEANDGNSLDKDVSVDLYRLTESFNGIDANWVNREQSVAWATPGGTYDGTVLLGSAMVPTKGEPNATYLWNSVALLDLFEQTLSGSGELNLFLKRTDDGTTGRELVRFLTKESATAIEFGLEPQLIIDYTVAIPETSGASLILTLGIVTAVLLVRRSRSRRS